MVEISVVVVVVVVRYSFFNIDAARHPDNICFKVYGTSKYKTLLLSCCYMLCIKYLFVRFCQL